MAKYAKQHGLEAVDEVTLDVCFTGGGGGGAGVGWTANSRLYRSRCLQLKTYFAAFSKIYNICTLLHRSKS